MGDWQQLDEFLAQTVNSGIPAVSLQVRQDGQVLYEQAAGWLDPDTHQQPTQPTTFFDLASLTKLFTATAFLRLVAAGKVELATPVSQILPQFSGRRPIQPYEDPLHPGKFICVNARGKTTEARSYLKKRLYAPWRAAACTQRSEVKNQYLSPVAGRRACTELAEVSPVVHVDAGQVTFQHLLSHSSGLPAWRPLYRQPAGAIREFTLDTFFAYPTGATVLYSDLGFILLGWAIEQLTGEPLEQAIVQLVGSPLDLSAFRFGPVPPAQSAPTEYCPWRERRVHGEVHDENAWAMGGRAGHAGLFGHAAAVAALGQAWLDAVDGASHFLLPPLARQATGRQAATATVRRGLGWSLWSPDSDNPGRPLSPAAFGHTGFTGTSLYVDPQRRLVIACLTNEVYNGRQNRTITAFRQVLHELIVRLLQ